MAHRRGQSDHSVTSSTGYVGENANIAPEIPVRPRRLRPPLWKKLRAFCVLLVLLGLVECGVAALTASHFSIKAVRVSGIRNTPSAHAQSLAQKLVGHNWLRINSNNVVHSIEKIPTVDHARVRRTLAWPLQLQAEVVVTERQPFVVIGDSRHWWVVDANGIPYHRLDQPEKVALNAITGPNFHPQIGKPMPAAQWQKITYLLKTMQQGNDAANGFRWDVRRIHFDRQGNVSLRLKDMLHQELLVQLGAGQWPAKLKRARVVLNYLDREGRRAKVLNLVSYKIPTWTPMSDDAASKTSANADSGSDTQGAA